MCVNSIMFAVREWGYIINEPWSWFVGNWPPTWLKPQRCAPIVRKQCLSISKESPDAGSDNVITTALSGFITETVTETNAQLSSNHSAAAVIYTFDMTTTMSIVSDTMD